MTTRRQRLKKLVLVQEQLKALHETRHATFLSQAHSAEAEARELAEQFDAPGSLSGLFSDLYHRRIANAVERQQENLESAHQEAGRIVAATVRTNMVERAYKDVSRQNERQKSDRERLEMVEQARRREIE